MYPINRETTHEDLAEAVDLILSNLGMLTDSQLNTVGFICESELLERAGLNDKD